MLDYTLRIRDLVHGTILFTKEEAALINHPYFQRLRQIRQNDVAFYVYPSMNTSRFEHMLGVCRVAGMMAETLTKSPKWNDVYFRELKAETGISSIDEFVKVCRFYALLHDIGHFPLSHLFEYALQSWADPDYLPLIQEWTGFEGFEKLHEAFGALLTKKIVKDINLPPHIGHALLRLMGEKNLPFSNPLYVIKSIMDSEIDADRIDFVQRDGLMAGGEYGHYDVRRLCDSVFIEQRGNNWVVAYSEKAITSMEAMLLDRYRTYNWVHFHHRVVTIKMLVRFLIERAIEIKSIAKEDFNPQVEETFILKDDVWLWNVLRRMEARDKFVRMVQEALFYRKKTDILNLWKTRPAYHDFQKEVGGKTQLDAVTFRRKESYRNQIRKRMKINAMIFDLDFFRPTSDRATYLYSEERRELTGETLVQVSKLVAYLPAIWQNEAQYFVLLVGNNIKSRAKEIAQQWIDATAHFVNNPTLW